MTKFITLVFFLSIACSNNIPESKTIAGIVKIELPSTDDSLAIIDKLYDFKIEIETTEDNNYNLVFSIILKNNSYYISPFEKKAFTGKFFYDLGAYDKVSFNGEIIETPRSVREIDPLLLADGGVKWVRTNTIYKQPLNILSKDDFEVYGRVKFTIEPRCTLEIIPYLISYKNGKMVIKEAKC